MNCNCFVFPAPNTTFESIQDDVIWFPKYLEHYPSFEKYERLNRKPTCEFKFQPIEGDQSIWNEIPEFIHHTKYDIQQKYPGDSQISTTNCELTITAKNSSMNDFLRHRPFTERQVNQDLNNSFSSIEDEIQSSLDPPSFQNFRVGQLKNQIKRGPQNRDENTTTIEPSIEHLNKCKIIGYIPTLYIPSDKYPSFLIIYFHGNGEDLTYSRNFANSLRNNLEISTLAIEYPGYGLYSNLKADSLQIENDAVYIMKFLINLAGYQKENIIIIGRSIGSGPATHLASIIQPGVLALISPFTSLRGVVADKVGDFVSYILKDKFKNVELINNVTCPVFLVHGLQDKVISYQHSKRLFEKCKNFSQLVLPANMEHTSFHFTNHFINPFLRFLTEINFNLFSKVKCITECRGVNWLIKNSLIYSKSQITTFI